MKPDGIKKVEEIVKENFSRIIKIHYKVNTKYYTSPGYIIPCPVNQSKKMVSPDKCYIKICNMLNNKRNLIKGTVPSKINIKNIYWVEVLDYFAFHEYDDLPLSDIVEICLEHTLNEPDITGLFTLDDKENTEKSLKKIEKMTNSKYPSFEFAYKNDLIVLKRFD
ncbi:hypothetical protein COY26_01415 [Candidatus Woesearchaeota archaeon CG_4_10_14_0_2_um_filter_33_10]|nr:MAG: hypothetical protein AUJ83_00430 [Candidatus Woesearchaeota archaeon CG1_02_33_12]PIN78489.1 MAG: hypothetical protein COV14_03615 [Candidatus Woesearchaeota archaeon CG10_big_fil_rev_8_21_14_0_10_33_12]PIU72798.1 MAG: hypothetical protein COS79_01105 [Candidatus Woesearchaeota archaeon CG06_land_8_20_14_3_00_33_13]PIZ53594.1 MAG: hypothetical protein COY26_01415 [Candidatus Woesearchaeota archaeon CG_4_10_14_0_2_um_filter_33_10]